MFRSLHPPKTKVRPTVSYFILSQCSTAVGTFYPQCPCALGTFYTIRKPHALGPLYSQCPNALGTFYFQQYIKKYANSDSLGTDKQISKENLFDGLAYIRAREEALTQRENRVRQREEELQLGANKLRKWEADIVLWEKEVKVCVKKEEARLNQWQEEVGKGQPEIRLPSNPLGSYAAKIRNGWEDVNSKKD